MSDRVPIRKLPSGVPGLDEVLGGGFPEFSFNLIAGGPGSGKTTMAHQIMFANASPERKAVYFSIVGEPPIKMLRYQQQYGFFDAAKVGDGTVRFMHLGQQLDAGMEKVLEAILREVENSNPAIVVVDSFRAMVRGTLSAGPGGELELTDFMQRLALTLTSYEGTAFLVGEYADGEHDSAVFTVADGLLWLYQAIDRNSVVRKLHVMKMRGQGQIPGLHTARVSDSGVSVFPRLLKPAEIIAEHPLKHRLSTGVKGLDEMLGGRRESDLRDVAEFREMFIGILGHDLRNPLGSIVMAAGLLLRRGHLDEQDARIVGRIVNGSQRMTRMIAQLLDLTLARLGGGLPIQPQPTDLRDVCRNVVDEFEATIDLEVLGDVTGTWDPDRLAEVLSNLAANAVEYGTPGAAVVVKAQADGAEVVVEVRNQGPPIPANALPFIFEPFRRAQQGEKSKAGNLGLGLYIARQIVLSHGGTLDVDSVDGTTTFVMRLPRGAASSKTAQ